MIPNQLDLRVGLPQAGKAGARGVKRHVLVIDVGGTQLRPACGCAKTTLGRALAHKVPVKLRCRKAGCVERWPSRRHRE